MKLLNFENCSSCELSKIGHYFRKYSDLKIDIIKQSLSITKNVLLNSNSSMNKKKLKDLEDLRGLFFARVTKVNKAK